MGTSASGAGAGGGNPLIPNWIDGGDLPQAPPPPLPPAPDDDQPDDQDDDQPQPDHEPDERPGPGEIGIGALPDETPHPIPNRFTAPRKNFNKYVKSGGENVEALKQSLRDYSRNAAGGTARMARRMQPSASRIATFYEVINTVKEKGKSAALAQFDLSGYLDKPLIQILSSFSDEIFKDTGKVFEDTQDDSITKQAYANTVVSISELDGIDLDHLTNDQVEVMMAIFIEETIAQRVICDIGNNFTKTNINIAELVDMVDNIYQIISGLVRNQIMPEIIATQRGDKTDLEKKIENVYRQAFDAMAGLND